jgi:hypothetical protein
MIDAYQVLCLGIEPLQPDISGIKVTHADSFGDREYLLATVWRTQGTPLGESKQQMS